MATGDVENIGRHCELEYCGQLDFLPFPCASCKKHYCLDHRSEYAHKCPKEGKAAKEAHEKRLAEQSNNRTPTGTSFSGRPNVLYHESQCSKPTCKTLIDTTREQGVNCDRCRRRYCLSHRHEEQHDCKTLKPLGIQSPTVQQRTQSALSKLKLWAENKRREDEKRRTGPKKSGFLGLGKSSNSNAAVSAQVELNALKRAAKGDAKVPQEKRIYLHVEASSDTTRAKFPTGKFFYSKDISVGRVLDMAAKALMVENVNNRSEKEEDKLRVFHVEGGRLLKFSEKIGDATQNGNMIVLLRGVGDGEPDLIDL
ncbi:hypothetical protein N0V87_009979 [Didymella glomerata]|uniref:AN1-type domain-containing protein n=1 Tax=Didymella glomerata TaxID=749621 RepID=A0A9W8WQ26_9PLEO|nr:hypothetical protein N0V87_009979 [Didymella glomerata]